MDHIIETNLQMKPSTAAIRVRASELKKGLAVLFSGTSHEPQYLRS